MQSKAYEEAAEAWWPDVPDDSRAHLISKLGAVKKGPQWQPIIVGSGEREAG
jgi:hypothetical protein